MSGLQLIEHHHTLDHVGDHGSERTILDIPATSSPENRRIVRSTPRMRVGHRNPGAAKPSWRAVDAMDRANAANSTVVSDEGSVRMEPLSMSWG
jgi:hypothetical protein